MLQLRGEDDLHAWLIAKRRREPAGGGSQSCCVGVAAGRRPSCCGSCSSLHVLRAPLGRDRRQQLLASLLDSRARCSGRLVHQKELGIDQYFDALTSGSLKFSLFAFYREISEKAMAPHSSALAWKIPWTEEPGRLQSVGSLRVGHD